MTDRIPAAPTPAGVGRAEADAAARGLAVDFLTRPGSGRPSSADVGGAPIVKTIVVQRGDTFLFVMTPLDAQFSWARLRAHLGVNRLSLPDADAAYAATGYVRGTITPLGASTPWPVILDRSLAGRTILIGAGSPGIGARLSADELVRAYGGEVVALTDETSDAGLATSTETSGRPTGSAATLGTTRRGTR